MAWQLTRTRRPFALGIAFATFALAAWALLGGASVAADDTVSMSISVSGPSADCDGDECILDPGSPFTVTVNADQGPDVGYILVQSYIQFGSDLTYMPAEDRLDEVLWPDCEDSVAVRQVGPSEAAPEYVLHGCITGVLPPLPVSEYTGPVYEVAFTCSDGYSNNNLQLLPYDEEARGSGAMYASDISVAHTPKVNAITVHCGEPPTPTPTSEDAPTATPPPVDGLPDVGAGFTGSGGSSIDWAWLGIAMLILAGVAGVGAATLRVARIRNSS